MKIPSSISLAHPFQMKSNCSKTEINFITTRTVLETMGGVGVLSKEWALWGRLSQLQNGFQGNHKSRLLHKFVYRIGHNYFDYAIKIEQIY